MLYFSHTTLAGQCRRKGQRPSFFCFSETCGSLAHRPVSTGKYALRRNHTSKQVNRNLPHFGGGGRRGGKRRFNRLYLFSSTRLPCPLRYFSKMLENFIFTVYGVGRGGWMCTSWLIIISSRFRVRVAFRTKNNKSERLPLKLFWRWKVGQDSCFKVPTLAVLLYKTINNSTSTREASAERRTCWKSASTPGRAPRRPLLSGDRSGHRSPAAARAVLPCRSRDRHRDRDRSAITAAAGKGRGGPGRAGPGGGEELPALPVGRAGGRAGPQSGLGGV